MEKVADLYLISLISIENNATKPLYRQIYEALRQAILARLLEPGARLPSGRDLAELLQVSRNTTVNALDQLVAEGYLQARVGAGIFVTRELPEAILGVEPVQPGQVPAFSQEVKLSKQGERLALLSAPRWFVPNQTAHNLFRYSLPDVQVFPFKTWHKLISKYLLYQPSEIFDFHGEHAGYEPLRQALAQYLKIARGVTGEAGQIVMVTGVEQAIYLLTRLLIDPEEQVWMEEPGFPAAAQAFQAAGAEVVPIPVDQDGLNVGVGLELAPQAKIVFVSPANAFPIGSTLSLERRLRLLDWAARTGAWVIEDDYDSEFRYDSRPLAALQGLDTQQRVIYLGTSLTMALYPGIRLDYVILPPALIEPFIAARKTIDLHINPLHQAVITDFITGGHFTRHIRRMRLHYKQRRDALIEAIRASGTDLLQLGEAQGGFHICGWLPEGLDDEAVCTQAALAGIEVLPVSRFYFGPPSRRGLVLGFAASTPETIRAGVPQLLEIIAGF
jgi:GntR family transcriptional regulator / MocR family aminotransferase